MRLTFDIEQREIDRLSRRLRVWQRQRRSEIINLIDETTEKIFNDARDSAPVQSGNLRDSIERSLNVMEMQGDVTVGAFYARFIEIEYGGVKRPATPFLAPAY